MEQCYIKNESHKLSTAKHKQRWRCFVSWKLSNLCGRPKTVERNTNCQLSHLGVIVQQHASRIIEENLAQTIACNTHTLLYWSRVVICLKYCCCSLIYIIYTFFIYFFILQAFVFSLLLWYHCILLLACNPFLLVHLFLLSKDGALSISQWKKKTPEELWSLACRPMELQNLLSIVLDLKKNALKLIFVLCA